MKLYHGSSSEITKVDNNSCMYFTPNIEEARQYALGLDDMGNYFDESFIYEIEIDENMIEEEEDFGYFDCIGYQDYDNMPEVVRNEECGWFCVKHPANLTLVEHFENSL